MPAAAVPPPEVVPPAHKMVEVPLLVAVAPVALVPSVVVAVVPLRSWVIDDASSAKAAPAQAICRISTNVPILVVVIEPPSVAE